MPTIFQRVGALSIDRNDKFSKQFDNESPLKKLIKIFRTGNVVRHHFQSGGQARTSPQGTAKAFFRNVYSFQSSVIPGYSAYDRFARYSDYAEMESYPILHQALNIIADEVTQKNENGKIIEIISESSDIQNLLQDLIDNVLNLNGKAIYKLVRNLIKYGDAFYLIDVTEENGVVNLIQMPANEVEREEGFDRNEPGAIRFRWTTKQNIELPNAYVAHFKLDGNDLFYPYGQSILEGARRPWRQLVLLEDAMMVYRITRSPERRVFFLDVMGAAPEEIEPIVNKFNQNIKKNKITNDKGKIDLRYAATLSMEEDYVIPVRGGDSATRIETLPGGQNIGDIEDIQFIQRNLFGALGIPKAFLTFDEDIGSKQTLTQEDIRFARTVSRIQEVVISELVKICMIHLYINGKRGSDLVNFRIRMTNPSTVAELQKNELWRARMDLVHSAGEGVFDTEFIYKEFLKLSDETIDKIRKGQILDKIFQSKLIQIENTQMPMGGNIGMGTMGTGTGFGGGTFGDIFGSFPMGGTGGESMNMGINTGLSEPETGGTPETGTMPPGSTGFGEAKDLTRTTHKRFATNRGVDEIPGVSQNEKESDPYDLAGINRTYKRPLGAKESYEEFRQILEMYRKHSSTVKSGIIKEIICKEYGIFTGVMDGKSSDMNETILKEIFGDNKKDTQTILKEAAEKVLEEKFLIEEWGEEELSKLDEECNKLINEVLGSS